MSWLRVQPGPKGFESVLDEDAEALVDGGTRKELLGAATWIGAVAGGATESEAGLEASSPNRCLVNEQALRWGSSAAAARQHFLQTFP